jgi:hypothetical protein
MMAAAAAASRLAVGSSAISSAGRFTTAARDRQALLLAAGQLHRIRLFAREQAYFFERGTRPATGFADVQVPECERSITLLNTLRS